MYVAALKQIIIKACSNKSAEEIGYSYRSVIPRTKLHIIDKKNQFKNAL